jgi:hypothetical protein
LSPKHGGITEKETPMSTDAETPTVRPANRPPTLDELIAEQGVSPLTRFEDLFGAGRDLWTDEEFAAFLEQVHATRTEDE